MVARDGIEPPTPAFSGPRSTTELPGQLCTQRALEVLFTLPIGMPLHLPLSFRGSEQGRIGAKPRARQLRQYSIRTVAATAAAARVPGSPAQRHLLANIPVSHRKMNGEFAIRGDGSALDIQSPALLSLPQKERLRAIALCLQKQRQ